MQCTRDQWGGAGGGLVQCASSTASDADTMNGNCIDVLAPSALESMHHR